LAPPMFLLKFDRNFVHVGTKSTRSDSLDGQAPPPEIGYYSTVKPRNDNLRGRRKLLTSRRQPCERRMTAASSLRLWNPAASCMVSACGRGSEVSSFGPRPSSIGPGTGTPLPRSCSVTRGTRGKVRLQQVPETCPVWISSRPHGTCP
jgi:hypothetical protein